MEPKDIVVKLIFLAICFQQWKLVDKLYKCKTQDPQ
jgi:hypothetical protein